MKKHKDIVHKSPTAPQPSDHSTSDLKCKYCPFEARDEDTRKSHMINAHEEVVIVYTMASQLDQLHESMSQSKEFQQQVTKTLQDIIDNQNTIKQELFLLRTRTKQSPITVTSENANNRNNTKTPLIKEHSGNTKSYADVANKFTKFERNRKPNVQTDEVQSKPKKPVHYTSSNSSIKSDPRDVDIRPRYKSNRRQMDNYPERKFYYPAVSRDRHRTRIPYYRSEEGHYHDRYQRYPVIYSEERSYRNNHNNEKSYFANDHRNPYHSYSNVVRTRPYRYDDHIRSQQYNSKSHPYDHSYDGYNVKVSNRYDILGN